MKLRYFRRARSTRVTSSPQLLPVKKTKGKSDRWWFPVVLVAYAGASFIPTG